MPLLTRKKIVKSDRVQLVSGKVGTVVFKGTVTFAPGEWYGIELDMPDGKHDGSVKNNRYFKTKKNHGAFAQRKNIAGVLTGADKKKKVEQKEEVKEVTSEKEKRSKSIVAKNSSTGATTPKEVKEEKKITKKGKSKKKPKRSRNLFGLKKNPIFLHYVHTSKSQRFPLKLIEQHFDLQKKSGNRTRVEKCRIIDLREWIAQKELGSFSKRKTAEVTLYTESKEEGGEQVTLTNKMPLDEFYDEKIFVIIKSKAANQDAVRVNRVYQLTDGRIGTCKFIGKTRFAKGTWIGLALNDGHGKGKHDGTVYGKRYFRCRAGMGIFVKPDKIRRWMKKDLATGTHQKMESMVDHKKMAMITLEVLGDIEEDDNEDLFRAASIDKGWKPADYGLVPDHGSSMKEKSTYLESELRKNFGKKATKKMTIAEFKQWALEGQNTETIEKIVNWKAADFDDENIWEEIRYDVSLPISVLNRNSGVKADKKLGAIDIGRNEDYEAAKFEINLEDVDYNITYLKSELDKHKGEKADRKAGAIETGRNDDYNAAKFDYNTAEVDYNITYLKKDLDKNKGVKAQKKLGAIEIGRAEGFNEARYEIKNQEIDYNITYLKKDLDKNKGVKVQKKLGAVEIGRADGFEEAQYDLNTEDIDYNVSRTKNDLNRNKGQKVDKKLTAIEIGRADNFEAAKYNINDEEIDYKLERTKKDLNKNAGMKVKKKPRHLEITDSYDFTPSKYDMKKLVTKPIDITYTLAECVSEEGDAVDPEPKVDINLAVTDVRYDICYLLSNLKKNENLETSTSSPEDNKPKFKLDKTEIRRDLISAIKDIRKIERKSILEGQRISRTSYVKSPELDAIMQLRSQMDSAALQSDNSSGEGVKDEEDDVDDEDEVSVIKQNRNLTMPGVDELDEVNKSPMSLKPSLLSKVASDL